MKILLLGKDGQVGWELQRSLACLGTLICLGRNPASPQAADLSQPEALAALVATIRPDVIVNAAAYTAVDRAESEPALAEAINATSPGVLARCAAASGALLVHYSTDYVFDGSGRQARDESAPTAPLSVYGRTKLAGEALIRESGCRHLIFRTSWVYAARGGNFAKTMLRLAAEREALKVIDDQIGAPTGADLLADVTAHAVRQVEATKSAGGLYHLVAAGETSWCAYARHVIAFAQRHGRSLKAGSASVQAIPTREYPTPAARPLNSRLSTAKLAADFSLQLPPWQVGVDRMLDEVLNAA